MLATLPVIDSLILLIEQTAALSVSLPAEVVDLAFQLCNIGGQLVSVEGLSDSLGQPINPGLINEPRWHTTEA